MLWLENGCISHPLHSKNFSKKLKKGLDKPQGLWYNKDTEREKATRKKGCPREQVRLSRQRLSLARSLCCASNKCEPNPAGVKIKGLGRVKPEPPKWVVNSVGRVRHF